MSQTITAQDPVGQLVRQRPDRSRVFENLGLDYCCGGKLPLADACAKAGLDPDQVVSQILEADAQTDERDRHLVDADAMSLSDLADHIEQTHHAYLRSELPRLDAITSKVAHVHGDKDPRLAEVRAAFVDLRDELTSHMMKEEQILFPMIRRIEHADGPLDFHCGTIANPIRQMEFEHDRAGDALAVMRRATDAYQPPDWACNTYRAMLDGLERLEKDMHQHVHKENNVLFPKALALEGRVAGNG